MIQITEEKCKEEREKSINFYKSVINKLMNDKEFISGNVIKFHENSDKIAVIIDPRFDDYMEMVIRNFMHFMNPLGWNLLISSYSGYESIIKEKFPNCIFFPISDNLIYYDSENKPNMHVSSYNDILLSIDFWNLIPGKYITIFQKDCIMFRMFPDYFYTNYEYSGANFYNEKYTSFNYGGINGGFSIRNRDTMIECLQKVTWENIYEYRKNIKNKYQNEFKNIDNRMNIMNEDIFFTHACEILKKNVPNVIQRKSLAIEECDMNISTCVYHGWDKGYHSIECAKLLLENSEFYKKYI
jgi:hypothetical protein